MSSEQFELKKEEFQNICDEITRRISELPSARGERRKTITRETDRHVEIASHLIKDMEDELRKAPQQYRLQMATQVRNQKRELEDLRHKFSQVSTSAPNQSFLPNPTSEFERMESSNRSMLLQGTESLNRASESIARSHMISAETDEIGQGIIEDLSQQRESLVRTRDRLEDTDSALARSRKILRSMAIHAVTNKLILVVIIILEVAILGIVLFLKLR